MDIKIDKYFEYTKTPWGKMFYEIAWKEQKRNKGKLKSFPLIFIYCFIELK